MVNDINQMPNPDINLDEIGKYGKFINFTKMPPEYDNMVLFPKDRPFEFTTDRLTEEKLTKEDCSRNMAVMQYYLKEHIEKELKKDSKLQTKISKINRKTRERIEKLEAKSSKKLNKQFGMERFEEYFKSKQATEEASLNPFSTQEQSPQSDPEVSQ